MEWTLLKKNYIYQSEIQHGCHFRTKFNIKPCEKNVKIVLSETTESFESKPAWYFKVFLYFDQNILVGH